jgi:putative transposase
MATRYRFGDSLNPHFITYTIVQWADALSRPEYKDIIITIYSSALEYSGIIQPGRLEVVLLER